MRVLLDTNVLLDVLLAREPWLAEAAAVWRASDDRRIVGYLTASTITDIFYIARRLAGLEVAQDSVRVCLEAFEVCAVDRQALEQAAALPGSDFEDNLQIACAVIAGLDAIVTRDRDGFQSAAIQVLAPSELLAKIG